MSAAVVAVTALVLAATAISGYARWELVDSRAFSTRVTSSLDNADTRAVLAQKLVDGLTNGVAVDALTVRPLLVAGGTALVNTQPFRRVLTIAVRRRHETLFEGKRGVVLDLVARAGPLLSWLRSVSPRVANAVPADARVPVLSLRPRTFEVVIARVLTQIADLWWQLLAAAVVLLAACAALAGSVRDALTQLGIAVAGAGLAVAAAVTGLGAYVVSLASQAANLSTETEHGALSALWSALFTDLRTTGLIAAIGGVVLASLGSGELATQRLGALGRCASELARRPTPGGRPARAVVLVAVGVALFMAPALVVRAAAGTAGVLLILVGAATLAGRVPDRSTVGRVGRRTAVLYPAILAIVLVATGVAIALVLPAPSGAPERSSAPTGACNGAVALCSRPLDEVVFPATHNSFAASDQRGWYFANQRRGIARQLSDGIRALLIDVHYGVRDPRSGLVRTPLRYEGSSRNKVVKVLGPQALRTADRLAGRVGIAPLTGRRGVYLCHTLCELGAEPLDAELDVIRRFLTAHPREVVVLFVEPYVPVDEMQRALERTKLLGSAAALRRDEPLPTLGALIGARTRLIVLAEEDGGTRPWYLSGFSFVQDTPLGAKRPADLSCQRARGTADSPLLLVNHWIDTYPPSPSRNERVGGSFLERRLQQCERERRMLPNLVAVDFYERTDVVGVVGRLNARQR